MKKVLSFIAVLSFASLCFGQAKAEGGYIMKALDASYSTYSQDQALNSMADWYTIKKADSTSTRVFATKYGSSYRCKQIRNNSAASQRYLIYTINSPTDTFALTLSAYESSGKLPAIKGVISGAVVDSTLYFFQRN